MTSGLELAMLTARAIQRRGKSDVSDHAQQPALKTDEDWLRRFTMLATVKNQ